jgi:hypothetical protein
MIFVLFLYLFIFSLLTTLCQQLRLCSVEWRDDKWMMNCKRFGRKRFWHNLRYYISICLEGMRKTMKTSVSITSLLDEIWTGDFLNTKQEWLTDWILICYLDELRLQMVKDKNYVYVETMASLRCLCLQNINHISIFKTWGNKKRFDMNR